MSQLTIEKVKPSDREEIEKLCSLIWDGHDYIPEVFDEWVKHGGFYCGRLDGKIIALDNYTWQKEGVVWLEGLRVHPDYRGRGFGRQMAEGLQHEFDKLDYRLLRFFTAEVNAESMHMAERKGFRVVADFIYLLYPEERFPLSEDLVAGDFSDVTREGVDSFQEVLEFVTGSKEYVMCYRQYLASWVALELDEELMQREVSAGNCYTVRGPEGSIKALAFFYEYAPYNALNFAFLAGDPSTATRLMQFGLKICSENGFEWYTVKTPRTELAAAAEQCGFIRSRIGHAFIYEARSEELKR